MIIARPSLARLKYRQQAMAGFTLIESVMVMVLLGIVAAMVMPKAFNPNALTLQAQARNFTASLQKAQLLAITKGVTVTVRVNNSDYSVSANVGGLPSPETTTLENNATFISGNNTTLSFDSLGQPYIAAALLTSSFPFQLQAAGVSSGSIAIEPVSGWITGP